MSLQNLCGWLKRTLGKEQLKHKQLKTSKHLPLRKSLYCAYTSPFTNPFPLRIKMSIIYLFIYFFVYIKNRYFNKHRKRKCQSTNIVFERKNMCFSQFHFFKIEECPVKGNLPLILSSPYFHVCTFKKIRLPGSWFHCKSRKQLWK